MASGGLRVAGSYPREAADEKWIDLVEMFRTYIVDCFANYPTFDASEEASLVEKFVYRGSSPLEVVASFQHALVAVRAAATTMGIDATFDPNLTLARMLALLVAEYQRQLAFESVAAAQRKIA
jgi:hypothetical protein